MKSFELARQINQVKPDAKIVFMTAPEIDASEFERVFPSTKVSEFIKKPVSMAKFKVIERHLTALCSR